MHKLTYCVHCGLSAERFQRYSKGHEGLVPPLARYLWNMRLSEALYPTLNCIEIGIRNSIHRSFSAEYGVMWFETPGLLGPKEYNAVEEAKRALARAGKPLTPEGIVAELSFGFWTTLMGRFYASANPSAPEHLKPWPRLLKRTFPHVPKQELTRASLANPLNRVRTLRNRVSHHEPVWHQSDLMNTYSDAQKLGVWLSPAMAQVVSLVDRFPEVYAEGSASYHEALHGLAGWGIGEQ